MLAQGTVSISGIVDVGGVRGSYSFFDEGRKPGPGGFSGGDPDRPGFGPGGGQTRQSPHAKWIGPLSLNPITGGSGGYGWTGSQTTGNGCGGGGAIVIASSASINVNGVIWADGGDTGGFGVSAGGSGSGGAIRLVANSIIVSGALSACGFAPNSCGVIRLESTNLTFTGSSSPLAVQSTINPSVAPVSAPQLSITSVGGFAVPANAGSRFDLIDVLIPNQIPDPVNVGISAQNIPTGTQVQVGFVSGSPNGTSTPCNLAGTFANSSCTATISNLNRTGGTYLLATAAFDPPASVAAFNPKGKDQVVKVKLESVYGGTQKYVFLRADGSVIDTARLSKKFLQEFGM